MNEEPESFELEIDFPPLHCPFCGRDEGLKIIKNESQAWVFCGVCHSTGPIADSPMEAAKAWNVRTDPNPEHISVYVN